MIIPINIISVVIQFNEFLSFIPDCSIDKIISKVIKSNKTSILAFTDVSRLIAIVITIVNVNHFVFVQRSS